MSGEKTSENKTMKTNDAVVDRKELSTAVEQKDYNKLYELFGLMADKMGYAKAVEYEDWKIIVITRAFKYLSSYTAERGSAFSYFYSIMYRQFMYEYRRTVQGKYKSLYSVVSLGGNEVTVDEKDAENVYVSIGGRLFDKDDIKIAYDRATKSKRNKKMVFKEIISE